MKQFSFLLVCGVFAASSSFAQLAPVSDVSPIRSLSSVVRLGVVELDSDFQTDVSEGTLGGFSFAKHADPGMQWDLFDMSYQLSHVELNLNEKYFWVFGNGWTSAQNWTAFAGRNTSSGGSSSLDVSFRVNSLISATLSASAFFPCINGSNPISYASVEVYSLDTGLRIHRVFANANEFYSEGERWFALRPGRYRLLALAQSSVIAADPFDWEGPEWNLDFLISWLPPVSP